MARILAVGFFDGVHLGHRRIIEGADAVLTFKNHPSNILTPTKPTALLMPFEEKAALIRSFGVKEVIAYDFTPEFASKTAEQFVDLLRGYNILRCGADWRFGKGAVGDAQFLREHGFDVNVIEYQTHNNKRISSTKIRESLAKGEIQLANAMLGRNWSVVGQVVTGKGLGKTIGYPTLNLRLPDSMPELPAGVYEVIAFGVKAIANWGYAPTMGEAQWKQRMLEIHFRGTVPMDILGTVPMDVRVEFVRFIRKEQKFATLEDLKAAIAADCQQVFGTLKTDQGGLSPKVLRGLSPEDNKGGL